MKFDTLLECFCAVIAGVIVSGFWLMFCTRYVVCFFSLFLLFSPIFCQTYSGDTVFLSLQWAHSSKNHCNVCPQKNLTQNYGALGKRRRYNDLENK